MPGDRVVVDGLWRCLCPSVDLVFLYKPFDLRFLRTRTGPTFANRNQPANRLSKLCRRQYSYVTTPHAHRLKQPEALPNSRISYLKRIAKRNPWISGAIYEGADPLTKNKRLQDIPTRDIYEALKDLGDAEDTYFPVLRLVEYLIKERGEKPNAALYEALLTANVSKQYGSARVACQLFREMQSQNIPTTPDTYLAVLKVRQEFHSYCRMLTN